MDLSPYNRKGIKLPPVPVTMELTVQPTDGFNHIFELDKANHLQPLKNKRTFVEKEHIIIGNGVEHFTHPLLNKDGKIFIMDGATRKVISPEEALEFGVFRDYYIAPALPKHEYPAQPNHKYPVIPNNGYYALLSYGYPAQPKSDRNASG